MLSHLDPIETGELEYCLPPFLQIATSGFFFTRGWYGSKQLESNCFCVSNRAHNHNISAYCMYNFPLFAVLSFFHHCFFSPFSLVVIESNMGLSLSAAVLYSTVCCINDIHVDDKELLKAHVLPSCQTFLAWHKNTHVVT